MRYILNSAVITSAGGFNYRIISLEEARQWIGAGPYRSTIRYRETALALAALVGHDVAIRDEQIRMQPGDEALVFRLVFPPGSPRLPVDMKGEIDIKFILDNCELGILVRTK